MSADGPTERWSPWWAIVLVVAALIPPGAVLIVGIQQIVNGMSGNYMSELSGAIGPLVTAIGVLFAVPGVLYLILRRRFLFVVTLVVAVTLVVLALL